jgi:hypothetical protein
MTGRRRPAALSLLIHDVAEFRSRRSRRGRLPSQPSGTVAMPGAVRSQGDAMSGGPSYHGSRTRGGGSEARSGAGCFKVRNATSVVGSQALCDDDEGRRQQRSILSSWVRRGRGRDDDGGGELLGCGCSAGGGQHNSAMQAKRQQGGKIKVAAGAASKVMHLGICETLLRRESWAATYRHWNGRLEGDTLWLVHSLLGSRIPVEGQPATQDGEKRGVPTGV